MAILVKKNKWGATERDDLRSINKCGCDKCQWENIWVELKSDLKPIIIGGIYRHPNGKVNHFTEQLEASLAKLKNTETCVIAGDININLLNYNHTLTNEYIDMMLSSNFLPRITLPTRITDTTVTLIDHIFTKLPVDSIGNEIIAGNIYCDITDHMPNFICLPIKCADIHQQRKVRIYSEKNLVKFRDKLQTINWVNSLNCVTDTNEKYSYFVRTFQRLHQECFPLVRVSRSKRKDKKWMTIGLKISIRHKNRLFKKQLYNPSMQNKTKYTSYRNLLNTCIKQAENIYYRKIFDDNKASTYKIWQELNKILKPEKHSKHNDIQKILWHGNYITNNTEIANVMNSYFCNIGKDLANAQPSQGDQYKIFLKNRVQETIFLNPVTEDELLSDIKKLNPRKSAGADDITPKLLVNTAEEIITPLCIIFNSAIGSATYPSEMKLAKVLALYKKKEKYLPENYRPISLLSCLDKLFEKVIYRRLMKFIEKHKILYIKQFGFRKKHSTILALISLTDKIKEIMDSGDYALGIYLDLKKAFDTVDHKILLEKLDHYGIRGHANKLIQSYLSERKQYTVINEAKSNVDIVNVGVPQGSVLGPLFFLLFINDIFNCVDIDDLTLFADDTSVLIRDSNLNRLKSRAETSMEKLANWFGCNRLTLNFEKSHFIIYHSKNRRIGHDYDHLKVGNRTIKRVKFVEYLGVTIDENLSWEKHVNKLRANLTKFYGVFYNIRGILNDSLKKQLYFSLVNSRLSYGIEVYGSCAKTQLSKLQVIQNGLLKVLFSKHKRFNTDPLYNTLKLLQMKDLYTKSVLKFTYNVLYKDVPDLFYEYFQPRDTIHSHNTRNRTHLILRRPRREIGKRTVRYQGAIKWNNLPDYLQKHKSINSFARAINITLLAAHE